MDRLSGASQIVLWKNSWDGPFYGRGDTTGLRDSRQLEARSRETHAPSCHLLFLVLWTCSRLQRHQTPVLSLVRPLPVATVPIHRGLPASLGRVGTGQGRIFFCRGRREVALGGTGYSILHSGLAQSIRDAVMVTKSSKLSRILPWTAVSFSRKASVSSFSWVHTWIKRSSCMAGLAERGQ